MCCSSNARNISTATSFLPPTSGCPRLPALIITMHGSISVRGLTSTRGIECPKHKTRLQIYGEYSDFVIIQHEI